ncbi:MAG TPA: hypothetical protein VGX48_08440 [Pyrinomonadaceae bacterium]|jgi:hypothetical protein|nr:hypothetical protein [Pyrinomonadaceae bacterium]
MDEQTIGFENDIKPLFTGLDRDHMSFMFDLWSYDDVKVNAADIYDAVSKGRMPPPPPEADGPWSQDKIDKFRAWMDGGFQP